MESFTMGTRLHAAAGARLVVGQFGDSDLEVLGFCSDKELDNILQLSY
jgi:hypothetical protein